MEPVIAVEHVWKRFFLKKDRADSVGQLFFRMVPSLRSLRSRQGPEEFWALRDITFEVPKGSSLGIAGNNGSGKSTLLKLLTRTMIPTKGTISTTGRISALIELGAGFHPDFTGRENIYLNASILGIRRSEIEPRIPSIVDFAELQEFIDTPVKYYSSGMNSRLGFSVATAVHPDILIVDEVLAVGDEAFQNKCLDKIRTMRRDGVSILFVSHALGIVERIMDNVLWLNDGMQMALGEPSEVIDQYRQYMGSTPVFDTKGLR